MKQAAQHARGVESPYRVCGPLSNKVQTDWVRSIVNPSSAEKSLRRKFYRYESGEGKRDRAGSRVHR